MAKQYTLIKSDNVPEIMMQVVNEMVKMEKSDEEINEYVQSVAFLDCGNFLIESMAKLELLKGDV
jgi:predicted house-cleaning NTP pyrophosphatase (Maf/HAM1 superfamily)